MQFDTPVSPHTVGNASVSQVMQDVIIALIPGTLLYCVIFSWAVLLNILIAIFFALATESLIQILRKKPVIPTLSDFSAVVTAWLFALALPPMLPWWATAIGIIFAMMAAKHLYGGLGYNPFNPAMVGYVLLLISFPRQMTAWTAPRSIAETPASFSDIFASVFNAAPVDAFTMATPLGEVKTHLSQNGLIPELAGSPLMGVMGGTGWEWISLAWFVGGIWLIHKKIITWHIPAAMLGSLTLVSAAFYIGDTDTYASPVFHILSGAAILGAFFIATDPVTAPASHAGKIMFGIGIGILVFVIRCWGGYPDGVAFAVLLMNLVAPTIDYFYRPRVFGQK